MNENVSSSCNHENDSISRQAVIDEIEERKNANGYRNVAVISELNRLEGYIMRLPSAHSERKMGRWIDNKCTACGKGIENLIDSREWYENEKPNYCPFCGKKFKEGGKNEQTD